MEEELGMIEELAQESMDKTLSHLRAELLKIRAGKASPSMLDSVMVEAYGASSPLSQVANVNTLDAKTLSVQPWDKSILEEIERGIVNANLGLAPQNNGEMIIINIPILTEERRRDLVKNAKSQGEDSKVGIRTARKEANDAIKKLAKDGLSEDLAKDAEDNIQKLTDKFIANIDTIVSAKEADIMKV